MSTLQVHLATAGDELDGAVDAIARWRTDPTMIGAVHAREALTRVDQVLRHLAIARGLLLDEVAVAGGTTAAAYENLLRERYPEGRPAPVRADGWTYERDDPEDDGPASDPKPGIDGYYVGRAARS